LTSAELQGLETVASKYADEANTLANEHSEAILEKLEYKEAMIDQMEEITEMKVKAFKCSQVNKC
jgi:hypothetical protein